MKESNERIEAREWVIRGRVQGVGFRAHAVRCAQTCGVNGWVTNGRDGAVTVVAEGELGALRAFEALIRRGPALARVDAVEERPRPMAGYTTFDVRLQ
jgi:acylphosphatase